MQEDIPKDFHGDRLAYVIKREPGDPLHYTLVGWSVPLVSISDPAGKIIRKRFLGIF